MSYQDQSDKDHLDIIIGPPGPDNVIDAVHNYAVAHKVSLDDAWTAYVKLWADSFIKPDDTGLSNFSEMFTDLLGQDVTVSEYFLSHYYNCFSTNGQFLSRIKNVADRHEYKAPALNFKAKNILDAKGKPINIRQFDELNRKIIQNLMITLLKVNWVYVTIAYGFAPLKKIKA
tara:strand:- start:84 stop:602 length:519 start_codon:yes stop_codon:yes gene_type:complete